MFEDFREKCIRENIPLIMQETEEELVKILKESRPKKVLEIGSGIGFSGKVICSTLSDCTLTTLEIDKDRFNKAKENLSGCRATCINCDAIDFLKNCKEKFDFVFLDGPKGQYQTYFYYISQILNGGGIVFTDNIYFHGMVNGKIPVAKGCRAMIKSLQKFLEDVKMFPEFETKVLEKGDGILVATKQKQSNLKNVELLAPAGNMAKFETALHFGADAVYLALKDFGLRAFAGNFGEKELKKAVKLAHKAGKKVYVTLNVFARNCDFEKLIERAKFLEEAKVDAVIVSDLGVLSAIKANTNLAVHISTQANIVNKYTAMEYVKMGASRVILARELSLKEIKEIANYLKGKAEVEVFVHGAMCISYSGRCLLSDYLTGRGSNAGACAQCCRWNYKLINDNGEEIGIEEDKNGTYMLNSKDLCLIDHLQELADAGVTSFKIEGRMKSEYYVATVVNAYRRKMNGEVFDFKDELTKTSNRTFTTGFAFEDKQKECYETSGTNQTYDFVAIAIQKSKNGFVKVEQRNRFKVGDELEILSPNGAFNKTFVVEKILNNNKEEIADAKLVQEKVFVACPFNLDIGDILRKRK